MKVLRATTVSMMVIYSGIGGLEWELVEMALGDLGSWQDVASAAASPLS